MLKTALKMDTTIEYHRTDFDCEYLQNANFSRIRNQLKHNNKL